MSLFLPPGGSDPMGSFFAPLTVMRRNAGFLVPGTTTVCTYNASFGSKEWKLLGVTPGRRRLGAFDSCSPQKACSYIFSPSFLFSLPPSLSPFALDLSIQLVYTMEMEDSLRSQGWKVSVCVKTCLLTVHPFMTVCDLMTTCVWEAYACASGISDGCGTMTVTLGS